MSAILSPKAAGGGGFSVPYRAVVARTSAPQSTPAEAWEGVPYDLDTETFAEGGDIGLTWNATTKKFDAPDGGLFVLRLKMDASPNPGADGKAVAYFDTFHGHQAAPDGLDGWESEVQLTAEQVAAGNSTSTVQMAYVLAPGDSIGVNVVNESAIDILTVLTVDVIRVG